MAAARSGPRARSLRCEIGWKDREAAALEGSDCPEGPLVERQNACGGIPLGQDDERRVGQPEPQITVLLDHRSRRP